MADTLPRQLAVAALVVNAFVWGVSWWPFRQLQDAGVHPLWSTALVYVLCVACALAVRPRAVHAFAHAPGLWLLAAAAGFTNVGFNWAVTVGDVVRVVLLFYLMPAWSLLLAWPLLGERPTAAGVARLGLALAGVLVVLQDPGTGWPLPRTLPDWLALAGGLSFALTSIQVRRLHRVDAGARLLAMFGGGALMATTAGFVALGQGLATPLPAFGWGWMLGAAGLGAAFLVGNLCMQAGASRLPAQVTALVMLSEVVFASLSAVALGASELAPRVLAGGAMILAAAAWSAWPARPRAVPAGAQ